MKLDALMGLGKKLEAGRKQNKPAAGFETLLRAADEPRGKPARAAPSPAAADEKKPRAMSSTDEALLVSRALSPHARPAPFIVTKPTELKAPVAPGAPAAKPVTAQKAVTLDQLAIRANDQHAPARVTGPTEKPQSRRDEVRPDKKKSEEPVLNAPAPASAAPTNAAPLVAAEPFRIEAPPALKDAAPLAPLAPVMNEDPSLRVVLLPNVARMSMDTGEAGRINVELKVQNGITELRATGPAAQLLESRQGELRVALAKEGLALGHFDLTQSGSQQRHGGSDRADLEGSPPPTARRATSSTELATEDGRVHVKA
ncbi:MAG: flagellar hook-length control protein FliK [Archangium sp.]|nr:flagellar hook-length control protein FliK [Archangium sp.]MDP3155026.1 flagellar hook-length control protein FliK [Archangium sp.]MDP3574454.1 flagellar hook-length control protein FliK [Archangium sp.]